MDEAMGYCKLRLLTILMVSHLKLDISLSKEVGDEADVDDIQQEHHQHVEVLPEDVLQVGVKLPGARHQEEMQAFHDDGANHNKDGQF